MKDAAADLSATPTESAADTEAGSQRHTARTRGLATAFGALATMIASACGGSSDASQPTDTAKPTTPPSATIEATTPPSIDSTTTITVETTTTDAPTTTEQSTTTEAPVVSVDTSSTRTIDINRVDGKYSALTLLLTGRIPTVYDNGTVSFDTTTPYADFDESKIPAGLIDQLVASRDYLDYRLSIRDAFGDFWYTTPVSSVDSIVVATGADEIAALRNSIDTSTGLQMDAWVDLARNESSVNWQVVDVCVVADDTPYAFAMARPARPTCW